MNHDELYPSTATPSQESLDPSLMAIDLTEYMRAQEECTRLKDNLVILSYELRSSLQIILGWTSLLRKGMCEQKDIPSVLEKIEHSAEAQKLLIQQHIDELPELAHHPSPLLSGSPQLHK